MTGNKQRDVPEDETASLNTFTSESSAAAGGSVDFTVGAWSTVDPDEERSDDADSSLGDDLADSTISLRESLYEGVDENGRKYHRYKEGKYNLPNDDAELDRLDLQHQLFLMTTDYKLCLAPIKPDAEWVLDIGTGTGLWAIDFAQEHPKSQIIGVDLSPSQPAFVPPNCRFEIDDVEEPWTWSQKFDYIHARMVTGSFLDWPKFFRQCYENTKPGGYLEMQDTSFPFRCEDNTYTRSSALWQWSELVDSGCKKMGLEVATARYKQLMEDAGFVDVHEKQYVWPQNTWPKDPKLKELGKWHLVNNLDGLEGYSMALFTRAHGMSREQVQVLLPAVRKDIKNTKMHVYWAIYFVYGRKPLDAS